ncbi:hypothetical protein [Halopseudomonas salegens]|uniref:CDP-Glycerol:Poly(Glycerophosphate) glycerophosphotransferase n=1 Tax=Halopseudomonas salegens TaxID=1434072 RepID=A0A1H2EJN1_9GAMM|nr:hypothetical protein [Halopseudomonas salegens]SDT95301.1 hypothetical protein SAMN05216210_0787 [Halopseudomonas salegens]
MASARVVYFSKMFQAVSHLAQVAAVLPGTFVSSRSSTLRAFKGHYPQLPCARYSRYFAAFAKGNQLLNRADVIVTGSPYGRFLAPYVEARKCTVFHGTYMMLSRDQIRRNAHYDLLCVIGPRMKTMMSRYADEFDLNTVETGFLPFCEYPEQSANQRHATLLQLGLDPALKTVLYTPSRRGLGSWERVAEQLVRTLPGHFNLIMRPHPSQSLTSRRKDRSSFANVRKLSAGRSNALLDLSVYPLSTVLSVADLIISDANSPSEEALFYDIPQLFIETDDIDRNVIKGIGVREGMHSDDLDKLLSLYDCGLSMRVDAKPDFSVIVDQAIADQQAYAGQRQDYFAWVFGQRDRNANQRVAAAIKSNLLQQEPK